jgi:uncharacterized cupredoxin-like copper-binding protein
MVLESLKSLKSFGKETNRLNPKGMLCIVGGKDIKTVFIKDQVNDIHHDDNNNGKVDPGECYTLVVVEKKD